MGKRISVKNRKRRRDLANPKKKGKVRKRNKESAKRSRDDQQRKINRWN